MAEVNPVPCRASGSFSATDTDRSAGLRRWLWLLGAALLLAGGWVQWAADGPAWMRFWHHNRVLPEAFWANLTLLGFGWVILVLVGALDRRDGRAMLAALLSLLVGGLGVQLVKAALGVARPGLVMPTGDLSMIGLPVLLSGSMPSGHAATASACGTLLVLLLQQRQWLTRWRLAALALLFALVAWSRVAVGAHWPADVLVGSGLGVLCGALCWPLAGWLLRRSASVAHLRHRWLWMCSVDLLAAALCFGDQTGYPQAQGLQQGLGVLAVASALLRLRLWWQTGRTP